MKNKTFLVNDDKTYSYDKLIDDLCSICEIPLVIKSNNIYEIFTYLLASIHHNLPITIIDSDLTDNELKKMKIEKISTIRSVNQKSIENKEIQNIFKYNNEWHLTIFTSGTTGEPKKIVHSLQSITRMVRIDEKRKDNVWGYAFNPTHIAGIQVFFQAVMNENMIINIFNKSKELILDLITNYNITNISATPTFYRMLLPSKNIFDSVIRVSSGGEKFDSVLKSKLIKIFPNAKINNIYASTEAGTLFASDGETFTVKNELKNYIKIENQELLIHKNLLGQSESLEFDDDYYKTGDIVEILDNESLTFRIISRKNEIINIGGYKVNIQEIEETINMHSNVIMSRVTARKNSVVGNILQAELVTNKNITEKEIIDFLRGKLQSFKVPRLYSFVESINTTRTGKIERK